MQQRHDNEHRPGGLAGLEGSVGIPEGVHEIRPVAFSGVVRGPFIHHSIRTLTRSKERALAAGTIHS